MLLAAAIVNAARRVLLDLVPRIEDVSMNLHVFGFTLGLAVLTGVAFGLAPLWQVSRARSLGLLHATGWGDRVPTRNRVRTMLVIGQISLTTLLLVGAGLLIQSLVKLQRVPVGFDADSVLTAKLALTRARLPNGAAINDFLSRLTHDLQSAPGITSAGISSAIPLSPGAHTIMQAAAEADSFVTCEWRLVDAAYFRTLGIPLLRGRLFGPQDRPNSPRVFVISQQTARLPHRYCRSQAVADDRSDCLRRRVHEDTVLMWSHHRPLRPASTPAGRRVDISVHGRVRPASRSESPEPCSS